jgi:hypothetical protein
MLTNLVGVATNGRAPDSDSDPHTMNEFVGSNGNWPSTLKTIIY